MNIKVSSGVTIAYDEAGQGPLLVLLHAFPLSRAMWRPQRRLISFPENRKIKCELRSWMLKLRSTRGSHPMSRGRPIARFPVGTLRTFAVESGRRDST